MKRATLIYNPFAGSNKTRRERQMEAVCSILSARGIAARPVRTSGPGDATRLARAAAEACDDLVLVCGGDGTVFEVVNGLANTQVPLAILPGGTANITAKDLRLPHNPVRAAKELVRWIPTRIALGHVIGQPITSSGETSAGPVDRYFLCVAGVGFDAYIIHHLAWRFKLSLGVASYVVEGLRQLFRYKFHPFVCKAEGKEYEATFAIVQRTSRYAGWFRTVPNQSITNPVFSLSLFPSRRKSRYVLYGMAVVARRRMRDVAVIETSAATFLGPQTGERVLFELDGELAGQLPATFGIAPSALTLLMPGAADKSA